MKKYISALFIIVVTTLLILSIYKLFNIFLFKSKRNFEDSFELSDNSILNNQIKKNEFSKSIFWIKKKFYIPYDSWKITVNQVDLNREQKYYLFLMLSNNDQCFLGDFYFKEQSHSFLIFERQQLLRNQRFLSYARLEKQKVMVGILNENQFNSTTERQNCKSWIKIENN